MSSKSPIYSEILHLFGQLEDHKVLEIIDLQPTRKDLEVSALYYAGMSDVMGEERQPLTGKPARIYEIVSQDDLIPEEIERAG
jgi:hypothetical protein